MTTPRSLKDHVRAIEWAFGITRDQYVHAITLEDHLEREYVRWQGTRATSRRRLDRVRAVPVTTGQPSHPEVPYIYGASSQEARDRVHEAYAAECERIKAEEREVARKQAEDRVRRERAARAEAWERALHPTDEEVQMMQENAGRVAWTFSPGVIDKARRYLASGRVQADAEADGVFWVRGSDLRRRYRVQTDADPETQRATWIACTCSHGLHTGAGAARCSHAVAVLLAVRDRLPLETRKRG